MSAANYVMIVSTECELGHEQEFNRWYRDVHLPQVLSVPGVDSVRRFERVTGPDEENRFLAIYEVSGEPAEVQARLAELELALTPVYLRTQTKSRFYRLI